MNPKVSKGRIVMMTALVMIASLLLAAPAFASEPVTGDDIVISEDMNDDLYVFGSTIVIDADIDGDVIGAGNTMTINGTVTGDVLFAGSGLIINGTVEDDVRAAGYVIRLGEDASVGDDLNAGGYSVEMQPGSSVGGTLYYGAAQALIADVAEDISGGSETARLTGSVGGNADISVGSGESFDPNQFFQNPEMPEAGTIEPGFTFGPDASIAGDLNYTSPQEWSIPGGVVAGKTEFTLETADEDQAGAAEAESAGAKFARGLWRFANNTILGFLMMLLVGVGLQRFAPAFLNGSRDTLRAQPLPSLGYGLLGYLVFFGLVAVAVGLVVLVIILSIATSGGAGSVAGVLSLAGTAIFTVFTFVTRWVAPILMALLLGEWLYGLINKEKKAPFWSLVLGLIVVVLAQAIPVLGGFFLSLLFGVFGLGAVFLYLRPKAAGTPPAAMPDKPAEPALG